MPLTRPWRRAKTDGSCSEIPRVEFPLATRGPFAWLCVDPARSADASSLSTFAPGWYVNLPMACRLVGDTPEAYRGSHVTVLPMTIRPGDDAADA
jgi:hypothetical protein